MTDLTAAPYDRWIGRKASALKRPTLDCECPNRGEVYFHLWCDRLACQEHADAPHDCSQFKGSKSSSEGEAVEPEAVVDPPAPRPLTLSPETYRALYGQDVVVVSMPVATTVHYELHQPEAAAPPVDGLRPFFITALDSEADAFIERASAALDELVEPELIVEHIADGGRVFHRWNDADATETICDCHLPACEHCRSKNGVQRGQGADQRMLCRGCRNFPTRNAMRRIAEQRRAEGLDPPLEVAHPSVPWWRRMLPGGTR